MVADADLNYCEVGQTMKTIFIAIGITLFGFVIYCAWIVAQAIDIYQRMN